ncbi:hypothetical protein A2U01_0106089 [Trifolium medium]|uniref:Uncharacterized protein n=1 Tax=Trifolium medium TaxID=97028 RepID=A0A392VCX2_9FABA|nr:hypothetical protein [Trifolium medium]
MECPKESIVATEVAVRIH